MNVLYLDTETTGTNVDQDQVIELAMQLADMHPDPRRFNSSFQRSYKERFRPSVAKLTEGATAVHGIREEDLVARPTFAESWQGAFLFLREAEVVVGYNLDFDLQILQAEFRRIKQEWPIRPAALVVDVFKLWKALEPRRLTDAFRRFVPNADVFVPPSQAHTADGDIKMTRMTLPHMMAAFDHPDDLHLTTWADVAKKADPERANRFGPTHHLRWDENGILIFTFGKHAGKPVLAVPVDYLAWISGPGTDFPTHVKAACRFAAGRKSLNTAHEELAAWAKGYEG